jgi:serine-type D-Ala-D-Ala carboxypeptidase/endopeptidase (penicillin-binding protein 4)
MRRTAHGGGAGDRLRRWLAAGSVLILAVAAITLALLGSLSHTSKRDVQFDPGAPVPASGPKGRPADRRHGGAATKLSASGNRPPVSTAEVSLQSALTKAMRSAGPSSGALVYDLSTRSELFALRPSVKRPPASVEKLWTTTALMTKLGPNVRLHTTVLGTGSLRDGVWHGNLYLRGGGDPTFGDATFNHNWELGYGPTGSQLVAQLVRRGIRRVTGSVFGDESLFDRRRGGLMTNYAPDVPDFGGQLSALTYDHGSTAPHFSPATFAANELVLTMRGSHIKVRASRHEATTPHRAQLLAMVSSPPMSVMTRLMDVPSDDLFAELLTKQLGVLFGTGGTISAGAHVIAQTIASAYDLHPKLLDGSGLSRNDRTSPLEIVDLLREVWRTTVGRELVASLPTVGVNGTVSSIGVKTAAQGNCVAKTGTLDNVTNLAGYCSSRGHHPLAFALFIDGPENGVALLLESRMIAAIARY